MRNYVTPGKSHSVKFEPKGVWDAIVTRVDIATNKAWLRVPRMTGDLERGPVLMPSLAGPLQVGDSVLVAFREGRQEDLAIVSRVGASQDGGDMLRYATVVVAAADSLHPEDADVICTGIDDDLTIYQIIEDQWDEDASEYTGPIPRIVLMEGTFMIDAGLEIDRDGVTIEGQGAGTVLRCVNPSFASVGVDGSAVSLSNLTFVDDMMASRVANDLSFGGEFIRAYGYDLSVSGCVFACSDLDSVIVAGQRSRITDNVVCGVDGLVPARGWSGGASSGLSVLDGSVVSGNMLRVEMPPGAPVISGVTLDGNGIVFTDNFVHAEFPSRSDTEVYSGDVLYATTVWASGDAITITGNYLYGWFEPFDGWVSFERTTVIFADYGEGGLVSGNVCDGNVNAGNSYDDTIVLADGTDGWQVTSNNLWPEYNNGAGTVVDDGYDSMVSLNNPNW